MGESVSGVAVLDKAMAILATLEGEGRSLAELAAATGLPRATAHRLALALEAHGMVGRDRNGRFVLGSRLVVLGREAGKGRPSLVEAAGPALARLRDRTGESTQLYVRSGAQRICVASLESPHELRTMVAVGAVLPMDRGSAGRVLSDQPDAHGPGWVQSVAEREPGVASVSAPVVVDGAIVGAVSVSGPIGRTTRQPGRLYATPVMEAARQVERALSGGSIRPSDRSGNGR